jgi:hypothetical protein
MQFVRRPPSGIALRLPDDSLVFQRPQLPQERGLGEAGLSLYVGEGCASQRLQDPHQLQRPANASNPVDLV